MFSEAISQTSPKGIFKFISMHFHVKKSSDILVKLVQSEGFPYMKEFKIGIYCAKLLLYLKLTLYVCYVILYDFCNVLTF